ncbi:dienelactone hydrolase family protein [Salipiger abyssi]|uniref:dienelactone hydrolase family protein n=1 Tax=Salipiger abyssi TaxID=1250539 RepID=UPI004059E35C
MIEIKVPYEIGGRSYAGLIVCDDDAAEAGRPVLFMQPDWYGVCTETVAQARELAEGRYVVLLADMFGTDYDAESKDFNQLLQGMLAVHKDLGFTLDCGGTAYKKMLAEAEAQGLITSDTPKYAVGYCAGGGFLMEQARAGEDFDALTVLHITNPNPVVPGTPCKVTGRVMAIHGSADPVTSKEMMTELETELTNAGAEWQTVLFGGAVHSFCVPSANFEGAQYDEKLCRKSYRMMHDFFAETA